MHMYMYVGLGEPRRILPTAQGLLSNSALSKNLHSSLSLAETLQGCAPYEFQAVPPWKPGRLDVYRHLWKTSSSH